MDALDLWKRRRHASLRETILYMRYAFQAGLGLFLTAGLITFFYYYIRWLLVLPPDYPYWRVCAAALFLPLAVGKIRTFLREADTVFLAPSGSRVKQYLACSFRYSMRVQGFVVLADLITLWPLYGRYQNGSVSMLGAFILLCAGVKWLSLWASMREMLIKWPAHAVLLKAIRWISIAAILYGAFKYGLLVGVLLLAAAAALYGAGQFMTPRRTGFPWEKWIEAERRHVAARLRFFNWFKDVPQLPAGFGRRRAWLSGFGERLRYGQASAYVYLYLLTFLRSELAGIFVRLSLLGGLIIAVIGSAPGKAAVAVAAVALGAVQLSALARFHRYSVWPLLYPLPAEQRFRAVARVVRLALVVQSLFLAAIVGIVGLTVVWAAAAAAAGLAVAYWQGSATVRRLRRDA